MMIKCSRCHREREIYAKGICKSCYVVLQNQKHSEKSKIRTDRWKKKNKKYWKNYYQKNKEKLKAYGIMYYNRRK